MTRPILIRLYGPFAVRTADGRDITPAGRKTQALLALVASAPDGRRARAWLRDKLWSESDETQSAASLRTTLSNLRADLSCAPDLLRADRSVVALEPALYRIAPSDPSRDSDEFLEGFDIGDPEFEDWLREMRALRPGFASAQVSVGLPEPRLDAPMVAILDQGGASADPGCAALRDHALDLAVATFAETGVLRVADLRDLAPPPGPGPLMAVGARARRCGDAIVLALSLRRAADGTMLWGRRLEAGREPPEAFEVALAEALNALVSAAQVEAIRLARVGVDRASAAGHALLGVHHLFNARNSDPVGARERFAQARSVCDSGVLMAWEAFTYVTEAAEIRGGAAQVSMEEIEALLARALEAAPGSPLAHALAAHTSAIVLGRTDAALHLSELAVRARPLTAMCWGLRATSLCYADRVGESLEPARIALAMAAESPYFHFFTSIAAMCCALNGRFDDAVRFGEITLARKPAFRANLRYLAASYAQKGDAAHARATLARLRALEPDFGPEALRRDDYPVVGARAAALFKASFRTRLS